jgi:hypothetical protein
MSFWACAQLEPQRTALALHCLALNGFEVYCPGCGSSAVSVVPKSCARRHSSLVIGARLEPGARVRVLQGPLHDQIGLLAALRSPRAGAGIAASAWRRATGRTRKERDRGD